MWTHSTFGCENANSLVPSGQRGTKNPSYSIIRNYTRSLYFDIFKKLLWNNELLKIEFPNTFNKLKLGDIVIPDKNPNNLMKIYMDGKFDKWVEKNLDNNKKISNSLICYYDQSQHKLLAGKIVVILNNNSPVYLLVQKMNIYSVTQNTKLYNVFMCEDTNENILISHQNISYFFAYVYHANQKWIFPIKRY